MSAPAQAAETCLAAPKGAAPQGSHWRYRVDQASQRKCWRLVQQDRKGQRAAAQAADEDDADEPAAAPPPAKKPTGRVTAAQPAAPEPAAPEPLVTKDASGTKDTNDTNGATQAVQWPDPPASMMEHLAEPAAPAAAPTQTTNDAPAPAAIVEQPGQQAAAAEEVAAAPAGDRTAMLRAVLAVIAACGLMIWAISFIAGMRRRRTDVLNKAQHLNALPREMPTAGPEPTFQPLPPMNLMPPRHDDVDEALRRFSQRMKRRAAA